jgi:hypothetical protein
MKSLFRKLLLAMVSVLAISAVASATASAAPEWLVEGKPVTKSTPVTFTLNKFKAFNTGAFVIECAAATGAGTVAPSGVGSITEFKLSKCHRSGAGNCTSETLEEQEKTEWVRMVNLSWPTKLKKSPLGIEGGRLKDWVEPNGTKGMGFEWECAGYFGSHIAERCEMGDTGSEEIPYRTLLTELEQVGATVRQRFETLQEERRFECSGSYGKAEGEFDAIILLKGPEGKALSYKET